MKIYKNKLMRVINFIKNEGMGLFIQNRTNKI